MAFPTLFAKEEDNAQSPVNIPGTLEKLIINFLKQ